MARLSRPLLRIATLALSLLLLGAANAGALELEPVGSGFAQPTYVSSDPGDAGRLLVTERKGTIQLLESGVKSSFADLSAEVECGASCGGERGLLSLALAPDFDQSGELFVAYANDESGEIHVDELVSPGPAHATATWVRELLSVEHDEANNHNGGQLQFGPDGFLYLSTGDGGGGGDQYHHAQDPASPLGKLLRIDPNAASPVPYELWSLGLRNPYRFSFDRLNGDLTIADVGQSAREEIDFAPSPLPGLVGGKGANYGWNCGEGLLPGPGTDPECATLSAGATTPPVFDYSHDPDPDLGGAKRCSIIGGYVIRDAALGALNGHYVYSDYCGGALRSLRLPASAGGQASEDCSLGLQADNPVSFGEDAAGRVYVVEEGGRLLRLAGAPPANCPKPEVDQPPAEPPTNEPPTAGPPAPPTAEQPGARPKAGTVVAIEAARGRVKPGQRAALSVVVTPCGDRRGATVQLQRDGRPNGSRNLDRTCSATFRPRINRAGSFAAVTREEPGYLAGSSRELRIRLAPAPRRR